MYLKHTHTARKLAIVAFGAFASVAVANAQTQSASLERQFWYCDYVGTTRGLDAAPSATCSAVTEQFMNSRFSGDYAKFLAWWKQNKPLEHNRLAERGS
jgi:O-glycosyl hydrolase